jgi:hypothetical protein
MLYENDDHVSKAVVLLGNKPCAPIENVCIQAIENLDLQVNCIFLVDL